MRQLLRPDPKRSNPRAEFHRRRRPAATAQALEALRLRYRQRPTPRPAFLNLSTVRPVLIDGVRVTPRPPGLGDSDGFNPMYDPEFAGLFSFVGKAAKKVGKAVGKVAKGVFKKVAKPVIKTLPGGKQALDVAGALTKKKKKGKKKPVTGAPTAPAPGQSQDVPPLLQPGGGGVDYSQPPGEPSPDAPPAETVGAPPAGGMSTGMILAGVVAVGAVVALSAGAGRRRSR